MASSLTTTAFYSRKAVKWFVAGLSIYIALYVAWGKIKPLLEKEAPPPPIVPLFGSLPALAFPEADPGVIFSYRLETVTGGLPADFSDRVVVFRNNDRRSGFFSYENGISIARGLGFRSGPITILPPLYQWKTADRLPGLLEMNVVTNELDMVKNWREDKNILQPAKKLTANELAGKVRGVMGSGKLWNDDLAKGDHSFIYYQVFKDQLNKVDYIGDADLVQVNFRRAAISELPVVHADPDRPPIWGLVTRGGEMLELHYKYWPTGATSSEYVLRSVSKAWEDLLAGKAHIARVGDNIPGSEVVIRHFEIRYFIANGFQPFTEPVYVINGDGGFMALVMAIERDAPLR